jgi:hypothetical protein
MNWDAVGAVGEVVGAVAVVISLIYLAFQIKHNTHESRAVRAQALMGANSDFNEFVGGTAELSKLIKSGMQNFAALTGDEQFQYGMLAFSILNRYDFAYHQYLDGELDEKHWGKIDYELPLFMSLPGMQAWWANDKVRFSKEFVSYVEKRVAEFVLPQEIPLYPSTSKEDDAQ